MTLDIMQDQLTQCRSKLAEIQRGIDHAATRTDPLDALNVVAEAAQGLALTAQTLALNARKAASAARVARFHDSTARYRCSGTVTHMPPRLRVVDNGASAPQARPRARSEARIGEAGSALQAHPREHADTDAPPPSAA